MSARLKTTEEQLADANQIIRKLLAQQSAAERTIRNLHRENDTAEKIREEILGMTARDPDPPAWVESPRDGGTRGVPCLLMCDWHMGEVVTLETTNGLNEFNEKIAEKRAKKLVETTAELAYEHMGRSEEPYPGIVVMIAGDMITGNIHPDLTITNDMTNQQAINKTTDLLIASLQYLIEKFGHVFCVCVCGNHPRDTSYARRIPAKIRTYTSHEWVIYCNLKRYFQNDHRIQFYIPGGSDAIFNVVGHRYLLTHGDANGVKGGDGIIGALGPIARGSLKVHDSEAQVGRDIDTIVMGHWHQRVDIPGVIVGNSFIGYNEHGRVGLRAKFSVPSQSLWFTHPKYGITARWEVFLEKKPEVGSMSNWVSWQTIPTNEGSTTKPLLQ